MSESEAEALEKEEAEKDEKAVKERRRDILKDLEYKCQEELDKIMADMNSLKNSEDRERKAQEELARIRRQNRRLKKEVKLLPALLCFPALIFSLGNQLTLL